MFYPPSNDIDSPFREEKETTKLKIKLADTAWQQVARSPDTRQSRMGSPTLADSSLPPISKTSVHSFSGNQNSEPSTPRKFMISLGLSKSQNSLTKLSWNESGDSACNSQPRQNRHTEIIASNNTVLNPYFKSHQVSGICTNSGRTAADVAVNPLKKTPWESARLSPVISADSITTRVIKFLAADNTLRSSPSSRNKLRITVPDNSLQIKSTPGIRRTSQSPMTPTASTPKDKLTRTLPHSPALKSLPFVKTFQPKPKNRLFVKDNSHLSNQKSAEKSVSIRRKIEQYRKKYDEKYTDKLKRLKLDSEHEHKYTDTIPSTMSFSAIDFTQILEARIHQNIIDGEQMIHLEQQQHVAGSKKNSSLTNGNNEKRVLMTSSVMRPTSGATWRTWRDINESDAYNDVAKYIRDNDLMDAERKRWIKSWIRDVQAAMLNLDDITYINIADS